MSQRSGWIAREPSSAGPRSAPGTLLALVLLRGGLTVLALVLFSWGEAPVLCRLFVAGLGLSSALADLGALCGRNGLERAALVGIGCNSLAVLASLLIHWQDATRYLDFYWALPAWVLGGIVFPASPFIVDRPLTKARKAPALFWSGLGTLLLLVGGYLADQTSAFYAGLAVTVAWLTGWRVWCRPGAFGTQAINTLVLLACALPLANIAVHPPEHSVQDPAALSHYYCYKTAGNNPAAFEQWWRYFWEDQWISLYRKLVITGPPPRFRPRTCGTLVASRICINSKGFRGREIPEPKGDTYRIVALGESSTFGLTIQKGEKPWPELLEDLIREQLTPDRRVEVINAGFPGITLEGNLARLSRDILPLKPDLIISYHGVNGFRLLDQAMPPIYGNSPPAYRKRPLRILADCEFRLKLLWFRHKQTGKLAHSPPTFSHIMESRYARAYEQLIQIARTNHIRLAIANFSMALNERSPPRVVEFFRSRTPEPYWQIRANRAHSELVRRLALEHPEVCWIDTHPGLDGKEDEFLDLVHFEHRGEEQMARNVFQGIKPILMRDLEHPGAPAP